ncbi:MAG: RHS repeat-associated core domain-containing protein [Myxococcota bacterium]|nr:RHS repeat-associated core domain-containing protein [Myxococcota bacterium]
MLDLLQAEKTAGKVSWGFYRGKGAVADLVKGVIHGLRADGSDDDFEALADVEVAYAPGPDVHTQGTECVFPVQCQGPKMPLVAGFNTSLGGGRKHERAYRYGDFRVHVQGHGTLGMGSTVIDDKTMGRKSITHRDNRSLIRLNGGVEVFAYRGKPLFVREEVVENGEAVQVTEALYEHSVKKDAAGLYFAFVEKEAHLEWDYAGREGSTAEPALLKASSVRRDYRADNGQLDWSLSRNLDGQSVELDLSYGGNRTDEDNWLIGLVDESRTESVVPVLCGGEPLGPIPELNVCAEGSGCGAILADYSAPLAALGVVGEVIARAELVDAELGGVLTARSGCESGQTRVQRFSYTSEGKVAKATVVGGGLEPSAEREYTTTTYSYDSFGNVFQTLVSAEGEADRITRTSYEGEYLWPASVTTGGLTTKFTAYDRAFGVPTEVKDPAGLVTTKTLDSFGRVVKETFPDERVVESVLEAWGSGDGDDRALVRQRVTVISQTDVETHTGLDRLGREVVSRVRTLKSNSSDGVVFGDAWTVTAYDERGRVEWASNHPEYSYELATNEASVVGHLYDGLNRPVMTTYPDDTSLSWSYSGRVTTQTNQLGVSASREFDTQGRPVKSIDALGSVSRMVYGPFGHLRAAMDSTAGSVVEVTADAYGNVTRLDDPDTGLRQRTYNGFGELVKVVDANGDVTTHTYDSLGRLLRRRDRDGDTRWFYDSYGRLDSTVSPDGIEKHYTYDGKGRPKTTTFDYGDEGRFVVSNSYREEDGLLDTITYPVKGGESLVAHREYEAGRLTSIHDGHGKVWWKANALSAEGQLEAATLGNGGSVTRTYDRLRRLRYNRAGRGARGTDWFNETTGSDDAGNVESRSIGSMRERFEYDKLHRLRYAATWAWSNGLGSGTPVSYYAGVRTTDSGKDELRQSSLSMPSSDFFSWPGSNFTLTGFTETAYNHAGNIVFRTNVGDYGYTSSHPHAVTRTDLGRYGYDSNGNQTSRPGHRLTYTPFNKIRTIVDDGGQEVASNVYDADESRAIRRDEQGTTVYVGGLYERQTTLSGTVHHKFYISGPDGVVAEVRRTEGESLSQEFYPIKDRMGSPFVITDGDGNVVQRQTFSAFGGVKAWDPKGEGAAAPDARMNLGYTGHEAQDSLGLIDMGGRTYDPLVARFLQADIFVQYPYNLQSFNRYTYGMNNPFRYLDPSGYASVGDEDTEGMPGPDADSGDNGAARIEDAPEPSRFKKPNVELKASLAALKGFAHGLANGGRMMLEAMFNARDCYDNPMARVEYNPEEGGYSSNALFDESYRMGVTVGKIVGVGGLFAAAAARSKPSGRGAGAAKTVKNGADVTDDIIRAAMKDAPLKSDQAAISVPAVRRYVDRLAAGDRAPPIKVDGGVIVDGNHRYVSGRLFGREPAQTPGTRAVHRAKESGRSWSDVFLDAVDWGNK